MGGAYKTRLRVVAGSFNILSDCHNSDVINSLLNAFTLKKLSLTSLYFSGFRKKYVPGWASWMSAVWFCRKLLFKRAGYFNFDWLKKVEVRRRRRSDANKVLAEMFRAAGKQIDSDKADLKEVRPPELFVLLKKGQLKSPKFDKLHLIVCLKNVNVKNIFWSCV